MNATTFKVSGREKEVLYLISHSFTTNEIAKKLFLSTHTIESHRKNLLLKLDARNTAGLVRRGFETGFLSLNQPSIIHS